MKSFKTYLALFAVSILLISLIACGSDDSGGGTANIAIFSNATYVGAEASMMKAVMPLYGSSATAFNGDSAAEITAAGTGYMFIPTQKNGNMGTGLDTAALAAIESFVNNGGTLFVSGDTAGYDATLVNNIFGYSIATKSGNDSPAMFVAANNAETVFSVQNNLLPSSLDIAYGWDTATLPTDGHSIYDYNASLNGGTGYVSVVVQINQGLGKIIYMAYDFSYVLNGGWIKVMDRVLGGASDHIKDDSYVTVDDNGLTVSLYTPDGATLLSTGSSTVVFPIARGVAASVKVTGSTDAPYTIKTGMSCVGFGGGSVCLTEDTVTASDPDKYESNDTPAQGTVLGNDVSQNHFMSIGDTDWFKYSNRW